MKKIYCRGLNFHGQLGLGKDIIYSIEKFIPMKDLDINIDRIYTNYCHTFAFSSGTNNEINIKIKNVYYFGDLIGI